MFISPPVDTTLGVVLVAPAVPAGPPIPITSVFTVSTQLELPPAVGDDPPVPAIPTLTVAEVTLETSKNLIAVVPLCPPVDADGAFVFPPPPPPVTYTITFVIVTPRAASLVAFVHVFEDAV